MRALLVDEGSTREGDPHRLPFTALARSGRRTGRRARRRTGCRAGAARGSGAARGRQVGQLDLARRRDLHARSGQPDDLARRGVAAGERRPDLGTLGIQAGLGSLLAARPPVGRGDLLRQRIDLRGRRPHRRLRLEPQGVETIGGPRQRPRALAHRDRRPGGHLALRRARGHRALRALAAGDLAGTSGGAPGLSGAGAPRAPGPVVAGALEIPGTPGAGRGGVEHPLQGLDRATHRARPVGQGPLDGGEGRPPDVEFTDRRVRCERRRGEPRHRAVCREQASQVGRAGSGSHRLGRRPAHADALPRRLGAREFRTGRRAAATRAGRMRQSGRPGRSCLAQHVEHPVEGTAGSRLGSESADADVRGHDALTPFSCAVAPTVDGAHRRMPVAAVISPTSSCLRTGMPRRPRAAGERTRTRPSRRVSTPPHRQGRRQLQWRRPLREPHTSRSRWPTGR